LFGVSFTEKPNEGTYKIYMSLNEPILFFINLFSNLTEIFDIIIIKSEIQYYLILNCCNLLILTNLISCFIIRTAVWVSNKNNFLFLFLLLR